MAPSASKQAKTGKSTQAPPAQTVLPGSDVASTDPAQRHVMIAEAAFFIAQARGFAPSQELDDWLAAEREIEHRLSRLDR